MSILNIHWNKNKNKNKNKNDNNNDNDNNNNNNNDNNDNNNNNNNDNNNDNGNAFVLDFDNTLTGPRITKKFPQSYHTWKVLNWNNGDYVCCANIKYWDKNSKLLVKNFGQLSIDHIKLLEYAPDLCAYFFDGRKGVRKLKKQLEKLNRYGPVYISSNGDMQVIYYILKCTKLLQFIKGIHAMDFLTRKKGHFINVCATINPFLDAEIVPFDKLSFMETKLLPKYKVLIYADDDMDNLHHVINHKRIIPFIAYDFNKEKGCLLSCHYDKLCQMFTVH